MLLGLAPGGDENGAGDEGSFLQLEGGVLPHVAEEVGDGVSGEALVDGGRCRAASEEFPREFTPSGDARVGLVVAHVIPPIT